MEGKGGKERGKGKERGRGRGRGKGRGRERGRERGNSWLLYVVCMLLENNSSTHSRMYLISHIALYLLYVHHVHITFIAHLFVSRSQTWRRPSDSNR